MPDLEGGRKWTFIWLGTAITPNYNENIEQQLKSWSGEKLKGCSIRIKLRIDFAVDNEGLKVSKTERYTILEILCDLQRPPEQTDLEFIKIGQDCISLPIFRQLYASLMTTLKIDFLHLQIYNLQNSIGFIKNSTVAK
jgi:hypothetical protein